MVCNELGISKGNYTFSFSSKDDILAVLTDLLRKYQRKLIKDVADDGISSLLAFCSERFVDSKNSP